MKATIIATVVMAQCPKCKEPLPEPFSGSLQWETNQAAVTLTCLGCRERVEVVIPKMVRTA